MAAAVEDLMRINDWTYEQLAQKMTDAGAAMWPSSIQKSVKSGRRITVDELIGYARAFETTPESLLQYGGKREPRTQEVWRDLIAAEGLRHIMRTVAGHYDQTIRGVRNEAAHNAELRREIEARQDRYSKTAERDAREQAERDREDVSTPEKLAKFMHEWGYDDYPVVAACRDALKGLRRVGVKADDR